MPNIKSAKKRVSVIERRKQENRYVKSTMATMIKKFREAVKTDVNLAESMLKDVISYIDSAESKGVIHKNNASRKISRLNSLLYKAKNGSVNVENEVKPVEASTKEVKAEKSSKVEKEEKTEKTEKAEKNVKTSETEKKSKATKETKTKKEDKEPKKAEKSTTKKTKSAE